HPDAAVGADDQLAVGVENGGMIGGVRAVVLGVLADVRPGVAAVLAEPRTGVCGLAVPAEEDDVGVGRIGDDDVVVLTLGADLVGVGSVGSHGAGHPGWGGQEVPGLAAVGALVNPLELVVRIRV